MQTRSRTRAAAPPPTGITLKRRALHHSLVPVCAFPMLVHGLLRPGADAAAWCAAHALSCTSRVMRAVVYDAVLTSVPAFPARLELLRGTWAQARLAWQTFRADERASPDMVAALDSALAAVARRQHGAARHVSDLLIWGARWRYADLTACAASQYTVATGAANLHLPIHVNREDMDDHVKRLVMLRAPRGAPRPPKALRRAARACLRRVYGHGWKTVMAHEK